MTLEPEEIARIAEQAISPSRTFRKGRIGDWRNHCDDETKSLLKKEIDDLLMAYGYETDLGW